MGLLYKETDSWVRNQKLDFKFESPTPEKIAKTLSAFSNTVVVLLLIG